MRVITGSARGRKLFTLPDNSIRPTTDFVKQAVFNILQNDIEGRRVLDLFAGSGQLGIEALSRGAQFADFVDSSRDAVDIVKKNLIHCRFETNSKVSHCDATAFVQRVKKPYDLIFLDPPYKSTLLYSILSEIIRIDILRIGGIIVCESDDEVSVDKPPYSLRSRHTYGGKVITMYTKML